MTTTTSRREQTKHLHSGGHPAIRHDGLDKVTGRAKFGADINLPGMLHGKVLRSPHAHARIHSIGHQQGQGPAGVYAVCTFKDFPIVRDRRQYASGQV